MRASRTQRFFVTLAVAALVYVSMIGFPTLEQPPIGLSIRSPASGTVLLPDETIRIEGKFEHSVPDSAQCQGQSTPVNGNGTFSVQVKTPAEGGMWIFECTALSNAVEQRFSRAYYIDPQQNRPVCAQQSDCTNGRVCDDGRCVLSDGIFSRESGRDIVVDAGALVFPEPFFKAGYSNFVPMLNDELETRLAPTLEQELKNAEIPAFQIGMMGISLGVELNELNLCRDDNCNNAFDLSLDPEPPNRLRFDLGFKELNASGRAFLSFGFGASFVVDVTAVGGLSAAVSLSTYPSGRLKASLDPDDLEIKIEMICFEELFDICLQMDDEGSVNSWLKQTLTPSVMNAMSHLDAILAEQFTGMSRETSVLGQAMDHKIRLNRVAVTEAHSLVLHWDLTFDSLPFDTGQGSISWAGALPTPHSTRPHLLISDRISNYVLYRLWAMRLSHTLPEAWLSKVKSAVLMSGYRLESMKLGMPPVLQPDPKHGMRLLLPEIAVLLREEDDTLRQLHLHASLPVRVLPSADNTALVFLADFLPGESDSFLSVECMETTSDSGSVPCSSESQRFAQMTEVGFQVAGGVSASVELPLTGPSLPGRYGQSKPLEFTRVQLDPDSLGWLFLETDY